MKLVALLWMFYSAIVPIGIGAGVCGSLISCKKQAKTVTNATNTTTPTVTPGTPTVGQPQ
jgi:hypothetical protein